MDNNRYKLAVLGRDDIGKYSLSPLIHSFFLKQKNIPGDFIAISVEPSNLQSKLKELQADGYIGVNLTIPHKVDALKFMDEVDKTAEVVGAVNTVLFKDNKIIGYNTDSFGFMKQLENKQIFRPIVFGAGGGARAVLYALRAYGIQDVIVCNRTDEKSKILVDDFKNIKKFDDEIEEFNVRQEKWENRQEALADRDLFINATSVGMNSTESLDVNFENLPSNAIVYDIVYSPLFTSLLKKAKRQNLTMINGIGMLLWQAAKSFEIWFGTQPEVLDSLVNACLEELDNRK
jgi:shikimate dehydrogenase